MQNLDSLGSRAVAEFIARHQLEANLVEFEAQVPTVAQAAAALAVQPDAIVKSIVFQGRRTACVALAIVPGNTQVNTAKVARALGLPPLRLAAPETIKLCTGYEAGGVPPIAHATPLPVVLDSGVLKAAVVYGGGGDEWHMLRIAPPDIVRFTGAIVANVTRASVGGSGTEVA